ncbi:MAG: hypothetical protein RIS47_2305 [Bacteroidota bacterium]|jgi:aspartyl-tRNA synthetase
MYRTHTCGELRPQHQGEVVSLSGWVQKSRDLGGMTFVDLRDRYGITQLAFNMETNAELCVAARKLGREFVIQISGKVVERENKNNKIPTGQIEIIVESLKVLSKSEVPPFTIEDETDGGEELRMRYRYLDLRRKPVFSALELRARMARELRNYLDNAGFLEVETPVLIKSTPEGARDFIVPSRLHGGQFYALPQSPQTFKQLLMVGGFDKYYQIVKCFRDEDFRADRQPEFTQIDCEMSFVDEDDIMRTFEGMAKHLFSKVMNVEFEGDFQRMTYADAMRLYGSDKPDLRFGMPFVELNDLCKDKGFKVFDDAELVLTIAVPACAEFTRKQLDALTEWVKRPQVGAKGLVYVKYAADGSLKSSVDKFYSADDLKLWADKAEAKPGDLLLVLSGDTDGIRKAMGELRLQVAADLGLRDKNKFAPLWVVDFPLLEFDPESGRYHAMHHPFTAPKPEDLELMETNPGAVRAKAYDFVINGSEIGGGSIRIHDTDLQALMFKHLGFTPEEARAQFGFLMDAFKYGAPPHGGAAFGFDRWVTLFTKTDSIREVIAFPKNNAGRDVMIDAPSLVSSAQLRELRLDIVEDKK